MPSYSQNVIQKVRQVDLLTFLKIHDPNELVYDSKNEYKTMTHDSLKISATTGAWYWFSQTIGGRSALDYLIKVQNYTFLEAMELVMKEVNISDMNYVPQNIVTRTSNQLRVLTLPKKSSSYEKAKSYLIRRGIDEGIIQECIDKELIYQEEKTNNVVFVGYDSNHVARYAMCRGITPKRFMQEANGSHKAFSFQLESKENCESIHLFESAIDLLSYATILKMRKKDYFNENLLSLGGVYKPSNDSRNSKLPVSLKLFLNEHQNIKKIYLHLDNDAVGRSASQSLKELLKNDYEVVDNPPPKGKDVNDFLLFSKKYREKSNDFNR